LDTIDTVAQKRADAPTRFIVLADGKSTTGRLLRVKPELALE
jgi:hypothetical protein